MAKGKAKGPKSVPNKHLHARISFLQQASTYLALRERGMTKEPVPGATVDSSKKSAWSAPPLAQAVAGDGHMDWQKTQDGSDTRQSEINENQRACPRNTGLSFHLGSHLRQVARKSQIRLHPSIKQAGCKICSATLIEGQTCSKYVENLSSGGRKKHADVLVLECGTCGSKTRCPIGAARQEKKARRVAESDRRRKDNLVKESGAFSLPP